MTKAEIQTIIGNITYLPRPTWQLVLRELGDGHFYVQVEEVNGIDNFNKTPYHWRGRKWLLSVHMCVTEVVQTCYKAITTAEEHEINEGFKYKGVRVYNPHRSIDFLLSAGNHIHNIDSRSVRNANI